MLGDASSSISTGMSSVLLHLFILLFGSALLGAHAQSAKNVTPSEPCGNCNEGRLPVRISVLGGYQLTQGNLQEILPHGVEARLASDLPLGRGPWPLLRLEFGYVGFGGLPATSSYAVTGTALAAGSVWIFQPIKQHRGQLIGGLLAGTVYARVQSPVLDSQAHFFSATALLGYEYPIGSILLFGQARSGYIADQSNPLLSIGGVIGVTRPIAND